MQVLIFQALKFDVYFSTGCISDRLRYYNGQDTTRSQVLDLCGNARPNLPISGSNVAIFQFITTSSTNKDGFYITYEANVGNRDLYTHSQEAFGKYCDLIIKCFNI